MWPRVVRRLERAGFDTLTELAARIALHGLSLAIAGEVVGSTALVAGGRARAASEATPKTTSSLVSAARGSAGTTAHSWVGAVAGEMAREAAAVAASAGAGAAQAQRRAVSLHVSKTLAMIALLGCPAVSFSFAHDSACGPAYVTL